MIIRLAHPRLHLALRLLLGGLFLYASLDKIAHPADFAKAVYLWEVGGPVASNLVAVTLPWVEAIAGVLLIAGTWRREASLVLALLLTVFLLAATSVLARGIDIENCGCTSVTAGPGLLPSWTHGVGWFLMTRNLLLLGCSIVLLAVPPERDPTRGAAGPGRSGSARLDGQDSSAG